MPAGVLVLVWMVLLQTVATLLLDVLIVFRTCTARGGARGRASPANGGVVGEPMTELSGALIAVGVPVFEGQPVA